MPNGRRSGWRCPRRFTPGWRRRSSGSRGRPWCRTTRRRRRAHAEESLSAALDAADLLAAAFTEQAIAVRRRSEGKQFALLGADLGTTLLDDYTSRQFLHTFNAAEVPISWRETETTEGHFTWSVNDTAGGMVPGARPEDSGGPVAAARPAGAARLALAVRGRLRERLGFCLGVHRAAVKRYRGKVDYWICAGRVNDAEVLALSEQERLRLVVRTIELIRRWTTRRRC